MTSPSKYYFVLLLGVLFISSSAILVKMSSSVPSVIALYRLLFTVLLMAPFIFWNRATFNASWQRLHGKQRLWIALSGVTLAFHFIFWFASFTYTSIASSVVLVTLQPLFTFAGSMLLFHESFSKRAWVGALLAIGGSVIIGWGDFALGPSTLYGDFLALVSALLVSIYWLIGQKIRETIDSGTYTFLVYSTSVITLLIVNLTTQQSLLPPSEMDWLWFLLLAIFPTLLGHSLFNWIIQWIPASIVSVSILGEAVGATLLAYFIFGEAVNARQLIGAVILLVGIFYFTRQHNT